MARKLPEQIIRVDIIYPGDNSVGLFEYSYTIEADQGGWLIDKNDWTEEDYPTVIEDFRNALKAAFEIIGDTCVVVFDFEMEDEHGDEG